MRNAKTKSYYVFPIVTATKHHDRERELSFTFSFKFLGNQIQINECAECGMYRRR